jgi:aminoglycoside 3-N-acetyltransferase
VDRTLNATWRILPKSLRARIKWTHRGLLAYRDRLFSVDKGALRTALRGLGVREGDVMYVRSSYDQMGSIRATPVEIIRVLSEVIGENGTLVMPTYPMSGLSQEYLDNHPVFDWRRTPSTAGMLTEVLRRMPGTERSLHPTHPLAARGPRAAWMTEGHEHSEAPFDERSPFQKLLEVNAVILSIGHFETMTLRHFADHQIRDEIPHPLYGARQIPVQMTAKDGRRFTMLTRANNPDLGCDHRIVQQTMVREGILKTARVGLVPISLVRVGPYIEAYRRYYDRGLFHHYLKSARSTMDTAAARKAEDPRNKQEAGV